MLRHSNSMSRNSWPGWEDFLLRPELAKERGNYVTTEQIYVAIELSRVGRIYVAIEDFWVAIELTTTKSLTAHYRAGREKAMCARQTRPGSYNWRTARMTGVQRTRQRHPAEHD